VSGLIFENVAGIRQPVGGATIGLWGVPCAITLPGHTCTTWYGTLTGNSVVSDAEGRYVAADVPLSSLTIMAYKSGYVQPCEVAGSGQNANVDVELVSMASLNTAIPLPLVTSGAVVVGTVFETTSDGPKGIPGAYVHVETLPDLIVASTVTDLTGHFTMCNVGGLLYVDQTGYAGSAGISASNGMAVELKRQ
jgi:hypothetical protein